ncbi:hypothetical protein Droror1_Dr00025672 [Drosera rotundifolia]
MKLPGSPAFKSSLPDLLAWRGLGFDARPNEDPQRPASIVGAGARPASQVLMPDMAAKGLPGMKPVPWHHNFSPTEDGAVGRGSVMVVVVEGECCDGGWRQWLRRWIWWGEMTESPEAAGEEKQRGGGAEKKTVNSVCGQSFALTFLLTLV